MKNINKILSIVFFAFFAITVTSCSSDDNKEIIVTKKSILDIAKADPNFSILVAAIKKAGLDVPGASPLSSAGSYTVFAPTNAAFTATLPTYTEAYINSLNATTTPTDAPIIANLRQILLNHILSGGVRSNDIANDSYVKTFATGSGSSTLSMYVTKVGAEIKLNGEADNGGAKVVTADLAASNGFIHVLDRVLGLPNIVNHAKANPAFSTLVTVVASTDPASTYGNQSAIATELSSTTGFRTVYAPISTALGTAFGTGGIYNGASGENITKVLKYHVETGNKTASSATSWSSSDVTVTTLLAPQKFFITKSTVKITEIPTLTGVPASNIKVINVQATNGIIHAIDRVLQPVL